jgi:peptide/nickel transport system permease protein
MGWRSAAARLGTTAAVLVVAMVLLFTLTLLMPGNPAEVMLGPRASPETIAAFAREMGLDLPVHQRLLRFFEALLSGDFGTDIVSGRPIRRMILEVLPFTVVLTFSAIGLAVLLGVPAGVLAAIRPNSIADRLLGIASVSVIALPSFVVAIALLLIFSLWLHWLPVQGAGTSGDLADEAVHLILPAFAIALGWVGYVARLVRSSLLEVLGQAYIRTARAFGVAERRVVFGYALKNAAIPTVAVLGVGVGRLLGGAVFAEIIFARPGMGTLIVDAINARNYPVVQASVFVIVLLFVLTNLLVDVLFVWLDPRLRDAGSAAEPGRA